MNSFPNDLVPIGEVIKPHGVKGQLKFRLYNEKSYILNQNKIVWLKKKDGSEKDFKFFEINSINNTLSNRIIQFDEIDSRDKALELRDFIIYVSRSQFPKNNKKIYFVDFIDCKVYNKDKLFIGIVKDVLHFNKDNDILLINDEDQEFMIPINNSLIELFDVDKKYLIIDIVDGLVNNI